MTEKIRAIWRRIRSAGLGRRRTYEVQGKATESIPNLLTTRKLNGAPESPPPVLQRPEHDGSMDSPPDSLFRSSSGLDDLSGRVSFTIADSAREVPTVASEVFDRIPSFPSPFTIQSLHGHDSAEPLGDRRPMAKPRSFSVSAATQLATKTIHRRIYGFKKSPRECFHSLFPLIPLLLKNYSAMDIWRDFLAGIIVAMIHFTQVFATAMTGSMRPHVGLFILIVPGFVYGLMSSSPHNSLGGLPIAAASVSVSLVGLVGEIYEDLRYNETYILTNDDQYRIHASIVTGVTFTSGCFLIGFGLLKLGFLSALLSPTVMDPFSLACILQSICSQLPSMFGYSFPVHYTYGKHFRDIILFLSNIPGVGGWETLISIAYATAVMMFRQFVQPALFSKIGLVVPFEFLLFIVFTGVSYQYDFAGTLEIRTVGTFTYGVPKPRSPNLEFGSELIWPGFVNSVVIYSISLNSARTLARRNKDNISPNQELLALGFAHVLGSFFRCITMAAGVGRGLINQSMGSKSQLSSIFASIFMAILIGYAGPAISYIPVCIISTNIVLFLSMSLKGFADLPMIWRGSRFDACVWVATFICCIALNVQIGLFFGIAISVLMLILKSQKPRLRVLGKLKNSGGFVPIKYYEQAEEIEGIRIIQIQSPFHYASAPYLIDNIKSLALEHQTPKKISPDASGVGRLTDEAPVFNKNVSFRKAKPRPLFRKSSLRVANISASYNDLQHTHSRDLELDSTISENSSDDSTPDSSMKDDVEPTSLPDVMTKEFILVGQHHCNVGTFRVILDLGTMGYMDAIGIRALEQVASDLRAKAIEVLLAKIKGPLRKQLRGLESHKIIPERNIFPSVVDAVAEAMRRIRVNTGGTDKTISQYNDERFYDLVYVPVEGYPFVQYDKD